MNDRELLEMAAKALTAAGVGTGCAVIDGQWICMSGSQEWNPLTDDGDALRLAVALRLPIRDGLNGTVETGNERSGRPIWEFWGDDPYAATRRAIVRAAAEIGRTM